MLTGSGRARPAPYLARAKWVYVDNLREWADGELADYLRAAHRLVAARLTKKIRAELGLQ